MVMMMLAESAAAAAAATIAAIGAGIVVWYMCTMNIAQGVLSKWTCLFRAPGPLLNDNTARNKQKKKAEAGNEGPITTKD